VTASSHSKAARSLAQIIENIEAIERYISGMEEGAFLIDAKTRDAVERCLQRLIEAVNRLKKNEGERLIPGLPWADIQGLGNRLRHEYDAIDGRQIWLVAQDDLPGLKERCVNCLAIL
jgi:uncharacterized protein with HEPN domain